MAAQAAKTKGPERAGGGDTGVVREPETTARPAGDRTARVLATPLGVRRTVALVTSLRCSSGQLLQRLKLHRLSEVSTAVAIEACV